MKFFSTRDCGQTTYSAAQVIKQGLADDGGLFVPESIPALSRDEIAALLSDLEAVNEGGGSMRFLIGRYGSGKSFLLQTVRNYVMDRNFVVLDADLANCNGTTNLRKEFPERAFDVGIAEQNMASVAAGLSSYGFIPFISSFTPFATRRICDQIAISIAYAKQGYTWDEILLKYYSNCYIGMKY